MNRALTFRIVRLYPDRFFNWGRANYLVYTKEKASKEQFIERIGQAVETMKAETELRVTSFEGRIRTHKYKKNQRTDSENK